MTEYNPDLFRGVTREQLMQGLIEILSEIVSDRYDCDIKLRFVPKDDGPKVEEALAKPVEEPAAEPVPVEAEEPKIGKAEIQRKVVELSAAGKKKEAREIVTRYAERVSAIPSNKCAEVWEQLTALEA